MQTATWLSTGVLGGGGRFFSRLALESQSTEAAHAKAEAVAKDGRCCMRARARCVVTEHLGNRHKSRTWPTD
jgi:hypothetical protein